MDHILVSGRIYGLDLFCVFVVDNFRSPQLSRSRSAAVPSTPTANVDGIKPADILEKFRLAYESYKLVGVIFHVLIYL